MYFPQIYVREFRWILPTYPNYSQNRATITGTLHKHLHACLCDKVTIWGIPRTSERSYVKLRRTYKNFYAVHTFLSLFYPSFERILTVNRPWENSCNDFDVRAWAIRLFRDEWRLVSSHPEIIWSTVSQQTTTIDVVVSTYSRHL